MIALEKLEPNLVNISQMSEKALGIRKDAIGAFRANFAVIVEVHLFVAVFFLGQIVVLEVAIRSGAC